MQGVVFGVAAIVIYFGIIGLIAKDTIDHIKRIRRYNKRFKK